MVGVSDAPIVVTGEGRLAAPGAAIGTPDAAAPLRLDLRPADFTLSLAGQAPLTAAYREVTTLAVDQGRVLLVLGGSGAAGTRLIAERLGSGLGTLVGEMRERRARQMLSDRFIDLPADERIEMVEYRAGDEHGVAQLAYHPWGLALLPLDERRDWRLVRRADIASVTAQQSSGSVAIERRPRPGAPDAARLELLGLGADAERTRARLAKLHEGALGDAAGIVGQLIPDAPLGHRQTAASWLVDGRPTSGAQLAATWEPIERAVLSEPTFAASYAALVGLATGVGSSDAPRWIAVAPQRPGDATEHMSWFLVGLPGNLLAFEMVSEGAHATYLFRIVPRSRYRGEAAAALSSELAAAVFDVSESLIDTRFLRQPIYLTESALAEPRYLRARLAIAALPSLRAARARFVGRLIHHDDETWARSLDDAVAWNAASREDSAVWPGGATDQPEGA